MGKKTSKSKSRSLRTLHKKAWTLWSEYIRSKDADWKGYVRCYTCGKYDHWRSMHAGHWIHNRMDFNEINIHVQCPGCNTYRNGRLEVYTLNLIEDYGHEFVKQFRWQAAQHPGYTRSELIEIINRLKKNAKNN